MAAQQVEWKGVQLHGAVQTDILVPESDASIGTEHTNDAIQTNTYVDLNLHSKYVDAGARLEYLQYPLPGFEADFKGWGVPHFYAKGKLKGVELTAGDMYEQFGSGFILRAYEERSLGIDNAIRGGRVKVNAIPGVRLTALAGLQRRYWTWRDGGVLVGGDVEVDMDRFVPALAQRGASWMLGASWVMKEEDRPTDEAPIFVPGTCFKLQVPQYVHAFDFRTQFQKQNFSILAEYAMKSEDPSHDNGYTFHRGSAVMLSASYSKSGFSALLQAKRSEDMALRSRRGMTGISAFVNNMPAFAYQHSYALAALYPYATQYANINETGDRLVPGEWAFQAELGYTFKRKTPLGGKYGTKVKANFSHIRGLDPKRTEPTQLPDGTLTSYTYGGKGYETSFFGMSDKTFYQDFNLQVEKKLSKQFKMNLMYMNQVYNQLIIENHGSMMTNNIIVLDGRYQCSKDLTLRLEYQHLFSHAKESAGEVPGDWDYVLAELTILPHFMISLSDMVGKPYFADGYKKKEHFYMGSVTYTHKAHRLSAGYGRTRAGYNCSGGVCRWVPASKGVTMSYNYSF
ncbi:MAG: hypothetical protein KBT12_03275 [Bacteroidales bacterium]|nr:hypothetical protein [Candidatus Physcousia equi]